LVAIPATKMTLPAMANGHYWISSFLINQPTELIKRAKQMDFFEME
jgi:hypothetical protein